MTWQLLAVVARFGMVGIGEAGIGGNGPGKAVMAR